MRRGLAYAVAAFGRRNAWAKGRQASPTIIMWAYALPGSRQMRHLPIVSPPRHPRVRSPFPRLCFPIESLVALGGGMGSKPSLQTSRRSVHPMDEASESYAIPVEGLGSGEHLGEMIKAGALRPLRPKARP